MSKIEPGCLAQIKNHKSPNYGKVVTVVEPYDGRPTHEGIPYNYAHGIAWIVTAGNLVANGGLFAGVPTPWVAAYETSLRRIDNPGDDEADLLLAPLPQQDKVPA